MSTQKPVSMWPDDSREASTLPSDFDGTIVNIIYTKEAPDNYPAEGNPIFTNVTLLMDGDAPETERTLIQTYNNGGKAGDEFAISDDGHSLYPTGDEVVMRAGSKWHMFLTQLKVQGVPQNVLQAGDTKKLFGLRGHWKRLDDAKLLGKAREFGDDKKRSKFPPQTLVLVKLLSLPGEQAVSKTNGAIAESAPAVSNNTSDDLDTAVAGYLSDVLANVKDNRVLRSQLTLLLSKAAMNDARRQDIARRGADEGFLKGLAEIGVVKYDPAAKPQYVSA